MTMTADLPTCTVWIQGDRVEFTSAFATFDDAVSYLWTASKDGVNLSDFARDLLHKSDSPYFSRTQVAWIHKIATDLKAKQEPRSVPTIDLLPVLEMLTRAAEAQKRRPRIDISRGDTRIVLTLAGDKAREPGTVNITDGRPYGRNRWFGRIALDGSLRAGRDATREVFDLLRDLALDPAKVAGQHGVATGNCCFCQRDLSTAESRSVGYGPICASKYGLPWGAVSDEVKAADAAAKDAFKESEE